jgi:hypothetical protein
MNPRSSQEGGVAKAKSNHHQGLRCCAKEVVEAGIQPSLALRKRPQPEPAQWQVANHFKEEWMINKIAGH